MKLKSKVLIAAAAAALIGCATPKGVVYFQDLEGETTLEAGNAEPIRLKPTDQISVIVNSRDPQVTAMFNLPYYTKQLGGNLALTSGSSVSSSSTGVCGYTVDSNGEIDFPILGKIEVAGLTRQEAEEFIKDKLLESRQIKDPVVIVEFMNLGFSVLGEVTRPGRYKIDRDRFTLFDALSLAGDLTINAMRENITLIRHDGQKDQTFVLNMLDTKQIYSSPAFYIQQGDVIYVTPNDKRIRESTVNGNNVRSTSFWISLSSLATSVAVLVLNFLK